MKDIEKMLTSGRLEEPRPEFDRRMTQLFTGAPVHRGWLSRPVPLWLAAAALLLVATAGYFGGRFHAEIQPTQASAPTVYIIQDAGSLGSALMSQQPPAFLGDPQKIRIKVNGEPVPSKPSKDAT